MIALFFRLFGALQQHGRPLRALWVVLCTLCYGASGFLYFEIDAKPELRWSDGFWWALVTMTTIGYGDFYPASAGGRYLVAVPVMALGVGLLGYALSAAASALVEAQSRRVRGMSSVHLRNHLLLINYPSMAKVAQVVDELRHDDALGDKVEIVLVDETLDEIPPELQARRVHYVRGNPLRDETLSRASIDEASQAVILVKDPGNPGADHQVVAMALAIEARHEGIHTVAECVDLSTAELLHKAGCDRVVCLARFSAAFLASEVCSPGSQDVIDEMLSSGEGQQLFVTTMPSPPKTFRELSEACAARQHLAIGVRRAGRNHLNPPPSFALQSGDQAVSLGSQRLTGVGLRRRVGSPLPAVPAGPRASAGVPGPRRP